MAFSSSTKYSSIRDSAILHFICTSKIHVEIIEVELDTKVFSLYLSFSLLESDKNDIKQPFYKLEVLNLSLMFFTSYYYDYIAQ